MSTDQPPPTLDEIAALHREMAAAHPAVVWHEAAARQIEALAGQGRQVERLRAGLEKIAALAPAERPDIHDEFGGYRSSGNEGDVANDAMDYAHWLCAEIAGAALAAPPAEEPREGTGEEG